MSVEATGFVEIKQSPLGADGLCITAAGLSINYDTLLQTCMAHVRNRRA